MRVTNTVSNLRGEDRDVVALRDRIKQEAHKHSLPTEEDLDKIAEEQRIKEETS
jgi:hypothetical protein